MLEARVNDQGQLTLPAEVLQHLGLEPGDEVVFFQSKRGFFMVKKGVPSPIDKYMGYFKGERGTDVDEIIREMRGA